MLRSLGLGLGLETFAKFLWGVRFRKIWYWKKSIGFGKIWSRKKVSISVSENLVSEKMSRYRFRSKFWYRHSVPLADLQQRSLINQKLQPLLAPLFGQFCWILEFIRCLSSCCLNNAMVKNIGKSKNIHIFF